jgi:LmbE family N-acetylglucosaminyl deacetylase
VKAREYFSFVGEAPIVPWEELTFQRPFVVLSPHPDDESLGMGGLIALARRQAQDVALVTLTDGGASHPRSTLYPRERLIATRRQELEDAAQILGLLPERLVHFGLPDAEAPTSGPLFESAVIAVIDVVDRLQAESLFVTWGRDPHCDHEAAALVAAEVQRRRPLRRLWAYPIWGWHLPGTARIRAPAPRARRIAIDEVLTVKRAAVAAHVSQMTDLIADDPTGFRFTEATLAPFLGAFEYFIEVRA